MMHAPLRHILPARPNISFHTPHSLKLLALILPALISGCGRDTGYPHDWQPAVIATDGLCPDITGTYLIADHVAYQSLAGRHFYEEKKRNWEVMTISGNPQESLQVVLYESRNAARNDKPIKLTKAEHYSCSDGWLQSAWPADTRLRDANDSDERGISKELSFAKNRAGELVIRTDIQRWHEIAVWCGDGCKYMPIPFTRESTYEWGRWSWASIPEAALAPPPSIAQDPDIDAPADESPAGRATRILRALAPVGVRIINVRADGERWIARVRGTTDNLIALYEVLLTSADLADVTTAQPEARQGSEKEVEFSFITAASRAEREAKAAQQKAQAKIYAEREAEDNRFAKLFVATLPKGATLTFFQRIEGGYQARVQCPDDEMIYTVVVNANASGNFNNVVIKNKTRDQWNRTTAEITLSER